MIPYNKISIGLKVILYDNITGNSEVCTVAYAEYDEEYGIYWLYLVNINNPSLNTKVDPKFNFGYYDVIENCNDLIVMSSEIDSIF